MEKNEKIIQIITNVSGQIFFLTNKGRFFAQKTIEVKDESNLTRQVFIFEWFEIKPIIS